MKHFHKYVGWLVAAALAGCGFVHGEGKIFVWNGTTEPVIVVVDGRTRQELPLRPQSGALIDDAVAGPYTMVFQRQDGSEKRSALTLEADRLVLVNVAGQSCFARADIAGMYQAGKPRVQLIKTYEAAETYELDDILHVFPGEPPPPERPRNPYAFQRMYTAPCELLSDDVALTEHLRQQR